MEITYTDFYGNILTEQQIHLVDHYIKVFKENNRLRKEEFYRNNFLSNTLYYIELGESHSDLLALNLESINIIEIEDIDNYYTKHHIYGYYNGIIESKGLSVEKNDGIGLLSQELGLQTNLPNYSKTYKFYEDQNSGYEFEFKYYSTGELALVIVSNDSISFYEQYRPSELDLIPNFEWWNQYSSYYLNAEPAIPIGLVII